MWRECVNISSNVSSCVVLSHCLSTPPLSLSPIVGEFACCHEALFLHRLINNVVGFFFLSEEKTQLVLNVDKQLEEVRELVCLWSVIFSLSHFLNYEFVARGGRGDSFHGNQTTAPVLFRSRHDMQTCTHLTWWKGGFLLPWLLPSNLLLSDTLMTHFKPLSRGGRLHVAV